MELCNDLTKYEQIDASVGKAARSVRERHLWYLSDETVGLALFSEQATNFCNSFCARAFVFIIFW